MWAKAKKLTKKPLNPLSIIFALGIILILISILLRILSSNNKISFSGNYHINSNNENKTIPVKINIPKAGIHLPVYKTKIINGDWQIADNGASYLETSPGINQKHSIIIYDHNTKGKFENLSNLEPSDTITIEGSDKKLHVYKVKEIKIVDPNDIKILTEDTSENLIVYTCYGFLDSKRLIVKAIPVS